MSIGHRLGKVIAKASTALALGMALGGPAVAHADWPVYGHDLANTRNAGDAGPASDQVPALKRAWTFNSSTGDFTGTPVVAGGVLVAGNNGGWVYALDAVTGRLLWARDVGQQINASAAIDLRAPGGPLAFIPVGQLSSPRLLALSLADGSTRWDRVLSGEPGADVFGSPTFWRRTVYIGTSGPNNDNTNARGSVVALDERSGRVRWQTYTVSPGHDGAGVWSTPAIDPRTGRLFIGTGNNYHPPTTDTEDSIMALDALTGQILGHHQTTANDSFSLPNNPAGPDLDFGASPNLLAGPSGERLVGEGQKSGVYWALDRTTMRPVWSTTIGPGSQVGGIIGSTAYDGKRIYGADTASGQVFALGADGSTLWQSLDAGPLHWSPSTVAHGVLYTVDPSGFMTARDTASGLILAKLSLGGPSFGGVSADGAAVYVAVGTGPAPQPAPQNDGSGSIIAFGDTSRSGAHTKLNHTSMRASTFRGRCHFSGTVTFTPALSAKPQPVSQNVRAPGTCTGTLVDARGRVHQLDKAPVVYTATEQGANASCGGGTAGGRGTLAFAHGRLGFTESETRGIAIVAASASGASGGSAAGVAVPNPGQDPVTTVRQCGGSGLPSAVVDIDLATTPAISG